MEMQAFETGEQTVCIVCCMESCECNMNTVTFLVGMVNKTVGLCFTKGK